jgi:conjugal transfer pilus assembly protein TraE
MNSIAFEENLKAIRNQRNLLFVLCCLLIFSLIVNSIFLLSKNERIVIVPPIVEKEFWVEEHKVSPTYLEQFGCFLGQILLTKSYYTAEAQRKTLLRHVDPAYITGLTERLEKEQEMLGKANSSYVFYITGIEVNLETKSVLLKGNRLFAVGNKVLSEEKESYLLGFSYKDSRLLLNRLEYIPIS